MSEQTPWHENVSNVAELARFLHEQYDYEIKPLLDMLAKPWKWECEYLEMRAMQKNPAMALALDLMMHCGAWIESEDKLFFFNGDGYPITGDWNALISAIGWDKAVAAVADADTVF